LDAACALGAEGGVLEFLAEEAEVVTASRRAQPELDSPVVIDVIPREEIEASGAAHLWDLLRFRPGLDVLDGSSIFGRVMPLGHRCLN
jgi:outer membrane cobalamin receptor